MPRASLRSVLVASEPEALLAVLKEPRRQVRKMILLRFSF